MKYILADLGSYIHKSLSKRSKLYSNSMEWSKVEQSLSKTEKKMVIYCKDSQVNIIHNEANNKVELFVEYTALTSDHFKDEFRYLCKMNSLNFSFNFSKTFVDLDTFNTFIRKFFN